MGSHFQRYSAPRLRSKHLRKSFLGRRYAAFREQLALFVQDAVATASISQIDSHRQFLPGLLAHHRRLSYGAIDLSRSNNDMKNLLSGTGIGTIFVDHLLRILRFTPTVAPLMNLIETDVGRPVDQIRSNLAGYDHLAADVKEVLEGLVPKELEVQTNAGEWYLLRIRPYRTLENVIEGAVITFTEISAMKKAQAALRDSEALRRLVVVVRDATDAMLVQDKAGRILAWNPSASRIYGWSEAEALGMNIRDLMPEADREQALAAFRQQCQAAVLEPQRTQRIAKDGRTVQVSLIASELVNDAGETYAIATTERIVPL
jgi:two-component system CheB/CheR fusion protein